MKEYLKTEYKPILIGILAYCILYVANELYTSILIQTGIIRIDFTTGSQNLHPLLILSTIISTLLLVVPGFLAGWYSNRRGIINGIVVISFCYVAAFFMLSCCGAWSIPRSLNHWYRFSALVARSESCTWK